MAMTHTTEGAVLYTYDAEGPLQLDANLRASSLSLTAASTDQITVKVVPVDTEDPQDVIVDSSAGTLRIEVPETEGGGLRFGPIHIGGASSPRFQIEVQIPEGSSIKAQAGSGSISAAGWLENALVKCGSGRVALEQGRDVYAKTGSGNVTVERAEKLQAVAGSGDIAVNEVIEGHLTAGSGDIQINAARDHLKLKTGSGDMRLGTVSDVSAVAGAGDIDVSQLTGRFGVKSGSGDISVQRAVEGAIQATAAAGDISVGIPEGTAVLQDCSTVAGRLSSTLEDVEGPQETEHRLELRARTVSGDISVHRA